MPGVAAAAAAAPSALLPEGPQAGAGDKDPRAGKGGSLPYRGQLVLAVSVRKCGLP